MNNINALIISEINNEYAKPIIPNICPKVRIPIAKIIKLAILGKITWPLFSFAKNADMYNVLMVVGTIHSEIIGIISSELVYSRKKMDSIWGTRNTPTNVRIIEEKIVKILIFFVSDPLESSGRVYFVIISGKTDNMVRIWIAK